MENCLLAWDTENITQHSEHQETVAARFEEFAQYLAQILADVNKSAIDEEEKQKFRTAAEQTLQETAQPDVSVLSAGANRLKGILAAVALGLQQEITVEAQEAAQRGIEAISQLPGLLP